MAPSREEWDSAVARIAAFERHVDRYEKWFVRYAAAYESEIRAIRSLVPAGGTGVEIGVGTGRFAAPLGVKVGVEPSQAMGKVAQSRGIRVIGGVAEALPLAEEAFDFALMVTTICFLDDVRTSLREARRVIRTGGLLIVGLVDRGSFLGRRYETHKHLNPFYADATFYSADQVVSYLQEAGFRDFAFAQTIFHDLGEIEEVEAPIEGYGRGSFVAMRALK